MPNALSPTACQILLALAEGDLHGYAILKTIARDGGVRLSTATLYSNLARLEREGLIAESSWRPGLALDDERRRYFQLTASGRASLAAELERMQATVRQAQARRLLRARSERGSV